MSKEVKKQAPCPLRRNSQQILRLEVELFAPPGFGEIIVRDPACFFQTHSSADLIGGGVLRPQGNLDMHSMQRNLMMPAMIALVC